MVVVNLDVASESKVSRGGIAGDVDIAHGHGGVDGSSVFVVDVGQPECSGDGQGQVVDRDSRTSNLECPGVECSSGDLPDVSVVSAERKFGTACEFNHSDF